jgi:hypothetical protein
MPCRSDGYDTRPRYPDLSAHLCAVLFVLDERDMLNDVLHRIDAKESGVSAGEIRRWWKEHQKIDEQRRTEERAERDKKDRRRSAIEKLTPDERKLLGLSLL